MVPTWMINNQRSGATWAWTSIRGAGDVEITRRSWSQTGLIWGGNSSQETSQTLKVAESQQAVCLAAASRFEYSAAPPAASKARRRHVWADLLCDGGAVLRPPSAAPSIHQPEPNESLQQLPVVPARLILPSSWNVWEFLILWREEERVIMGPVWLFINLPFPFFRGCCYFPPSRPHWLRHSDTKTQNKAFLFHFGKKNPLVLWKSHRKLGLRRGGCFSSKSSGNIMKSLCYACRSLLLFNVFFSLHQVEIKVSTSFCCEQMKLKWLKATRRPRAPAHLSAAPELTWSWWSFEFNDSKNEWKLASCAQVFYKDNKNNNIQDTK